MSDAQPQQPVERTAVGYRITARRRRLQRALIVSTDMRIIHQDFTKWWHANPVEDELNRRGYDVTRRQFDRWAQLIAFLQEPQEPRFGRVVFITHGGMDGPILGHSTDADPGYQGQAPVRSAEFTQFAAALAGATTDDARVYISACHTGGDDAAERARNGFTISWSAALGEATNRRVVGPTGFTAWRRTHEAVLCALEETGPAPQELVVFEGDRVVAIRPGETYAQARAVVLDATVAPAAARPGEVVTVRAWPTAGDEELYLAFVGRQYKSHLVLHAEVAREGRVMIARVRVPADAAGGRLRVKYHADEVTLPFEVRRSASGRF